MTAPAPVRRALWLTSAAVGLAACRMSAPPPPIQVPVPSSAAEAPTGFDNRSNGTVDDSTHQADQDVFDEVEGLADGVGPRYSAQGRRERPQIPSSGAAAPSRECAVGEQGAEGHQ